MRREHRTGLSVACICALIAFSMTFVAGCTAPSRVTGPSSASSARTETEAPSRREIVSASGAVVPARRATLALPTGGRVTKVHVKAGEQVAAGQPLLQLETAQLQAVVELAKANLEAAQAEFNQLSAGPRAQQVAAAEAAVDSTRAGLKQAQAGLQGAEAALQTAQQALRSAELQTNVARVGVQAAQAQLARVKAGPGAEAIAVAKAQMEKAEALRALAQSEYDKVSWSGAAGASPQAVALQQATADYEAARAAYQSLLAQPRAEDIAIAEAGVAQAQAQLAAAQSNAAGATSATEQARAARDAAAAAVQLAQAGVTRAQAELELLQAGATVAQLTAARARVAAAKAALAQAEAALAQATLTAPFAGVAAEVLVREGEIVSPATPLIEFGDLAHLRVETTDLNEIDLYKLRLGQNVEVTFDALPGRKITGVVSEMAYKATRGQAGTNYTVIIELAEQEPRLRWGMTAFIDAVSE